MFFFCFKVDQNVVQINNAQIIYQFSQYFVDFRLKGDRGIKQFKQHYRVFEKIIAGSKRCFLFVFCTNTNAIISVFKIQFRKVAYID